MHPQNDLRDRYRHPSQAWQEFTLDAVNQSIGARFEDQVARQPDHLAAQNDDRSYSYSQLNRQANRVAHAILARQGEQSSPPAVAILLPNDAPMLAAMLGVLKSGAAYVPFDPAFPQERLAWYWQDAGATLLLTDTEHYDLAVALAGDAGQVLAIDSLDADLPEQNPGIAVAPDAVAYIYYTSGSTGRPKSVYNSHRNLLHHIRRNSNIFCVCPADRFLCLKSFSFAGALKDIFGSLLNGASIHLYPLKQKGMARLADWLVEEEITIYNSVATVFRQFTDTLTPTSRFPHLRIVYFGGEQIKTNDLALFQQYFGRNSLLVLGLGSTETGPVTAFYLGGDGPLPGEVVPLGYPAQETEILILDESGNLLGAEQEGEIAIKSDYLALGYWGNDELTRQKFVAAQDGSRLYLTGDVGYLDDTNCLHHRGRRDFQIKIRGYRVEPAEIEDCLRQHPAIQQVVVVAKALHSGEQGLVAYFVNGDAHLPTVSELRGLLAGQLPDYMIPAAFVPLEALPVNAFGKLDLKALAAPERVRPHLAQAYSPPSNPAQERLAALWCGLLGIDEVGIHDDFLELGGSSVLMMQLLTRTEQRFGCEIPVADFVAEPTIATLADLIERVPA